MINKITDRRRELIQTASLVTTTLFLVILTITIIFSVELGRLKSRVDFLEAITNEAISLEYVTEVIGE